MIWGVAISNLNLLGLCPGSNTRHVLQDIAEENFKGPEPPGSIPVTLDISGMYSNVPWTEGLVAFEEAMNTREEQHVPTDFLMRLLMLVLSCNVFVFDGILFLKLFGVPWGSRVAPTFDCLFMGWLDTRLLQCWINLVEEVHR